MHNISESNNKKFFQADSDLNYNNAEKKVLLITEQFPNNGFAWKVLGALYRIKKDRFGELEANKKAIKLLPNDSESFNNLGITLQEMGSLKESEIILKKAISLNVNFPEALNNLGNTLRKMNKLREAKVNLNQAINIRPNYTEAINNLSLTLYEMNRLDEAEVMCRKALFLSPNNVQFLANLGIILNKIGKLEEAIESFICSIKLNPNQNNAWENIYYPIQAIKYKNTINKNYPPFILNEKLLKNNNIELAILKFRLNIEENQSSFFFKNITNIISDNENKTLKNPILANSFKKKVELPKKVIALLHFGRSGSGLLHSLIDSHSEISTLPSIYFSQFFDRSIWKILNEKGFKRIVDRFIECYPVLFDASVSHPVKTIGLSYTEDIGIKEGMANVGENKSECLYVNKNIFRKELNLLMSQYDNIDQLTFFKLVHIAYEKTINNTYKKPIIFYHIHNPDLYAKVNFIKLAPNTKWVMMVRNPVQSCESWIYQSFLDNKYEKIIACIIQMLFDIDRIEFKDFNFIGLRLEDLKSNPKETICKLCNWMEVNEEESLFSMTAQGKKWWGDKSALNNNAFGIMPKFKGKVFSNNDRFILNTLFYPFCEKFGYVNKDLKKFKKDLKTVYPMINNIFDFEKEIVNNTNTTLKQFKKSTSYLYIRSKLLDRWKVLNKYYTYPNMIKPMKIK